MWESPWGWRRKDSRNSSSLNASAPCHVSRIPVDRAYRTNTYWSLLHFSGCLEKRISGERVWCGSHAKKKDLMKLLSVKEWNARHGRGKNTANEFKKKNNVWHPSRLSGLSLRAVGRSPEHHRGPLFANRKWRKHKRVVQHLCVWTFFLIS